MSLEKSEVKLGTVHEIGCRLDDVREAAIKEVSRMEGAGIAFAKAAETVSALAAHVDRDLDEGKYELEVAGHIKRYLERAAQALTNLHMNAKNLQLVSQGKVQGLDASLSVAKKLKEEEERKVTAALEAAEAAQATAETAPDAEEEARRPPPPIKAQRLAEQQAPAGKRGRRKR